MATCVLGEDSKENLKTVQLSNNTVNHIIPDVSVHIRQAVGTAALVQLCFFVSRKGGEL